MMILPGSFFDQDACTLAKQLLGKVIRKRYRSYWLSAQIIETEAYYMEEKGSHASLGFTEKRRALFMSPGTIYMYYALMAVIPGMSTLCMISVSGHMAHQVPLQLPYCPTAQAHMILVTCLQARQTQPVLKSGTRARGP